MATTARGLSRALPRLGRAFPRSGATAAVFRLGHYALRPKAASPFGEVSVSMVSTDQPRFFLSFQGLPASVRRSGARWPDISASQADLRCIGTERALRGGLCQEQSRLSGL